MRALCDLITSKIDCRMRSVTSNRLYLPSIIIFDEAADFGYFSSRDRVSALQSVYKMRN